MLATPIPILYLLVPIALILAGVGVYGFLWAVRTGQYEDVDTPAIRLLLEDEETQAETSAERQFAARKANPLATDSEGEVSSKR